MKNQFEDFQKMKIKEACKSIEDMTYTFVNPITNEPTFVPASHYEKILGKTVEQFLDEQLKIEMLNNVYNQLQFMQKEYGNDFIMSLICMEMKIKPMDLTTVQRIALKKTNEYIADEKAQAKSKFHLLDQSILDKFNEVMNDKELHASIFRGQEMEEEKDVEDSFDEPDFL